MTSRSPRRWLWRSPPPTISTSCPRPLRWCPRPGRSSVRSPDPPTRWAIATATLSGDNLGLDTRVLFDGAAATSIQKNDDGTFTVAAPPAIGNHIAVVEALAERRADLRPDHGHVASADVHLLVAGSSGAFDHSGHRHRRHRHHDRSRRIRHQLRGRPDGDRIWIERRGRAADLDHRPRQSAAEHFREQRSAQQD